MIPASYLFKDIYRQHWEEPDAPPAIGGRHVSGGLMRPLTAFATKLLRRPARPHGHYFAGRAYE